MTEQNSKNDDRRSFEVTVDGNKRTLFVGVPSADQIRKSDWHYSKVYNKALMEGVSTAAEMLDILTSRGIYGPEYEKKLQDLRIEIALKIAQMQNEKDQVRQTEMAYEVANLRDELYRWNHRLQGPLRNCCEQMAEDAKTEYLTSAVIQDETGKPYWKDYDSFISEKNQGLALKARVEVLLWLEGLESDFLDETPEKRVLRNIAKQQAELEVAMAEAVTDELPEVEAEVPSEDKKTTRKKAKA